MRRKEGKYAQLSLITVDAQGLGKQDESSEDPIRRR